MDCNDYEFGGWIFDDYERIAEIRFGFVPEYYFVCSSQEYIAVSFVESNLQWWSCFLGVSLFSGQIVPLCHRHSVVRHF
jgi:hypothetical protein